MGVGALQTDTQGLRTVLCSGKILGDFFCLGTEPKEGLLRGFQQRDPGIRGNSMICIFFFFLSTKQYDKNLILPKDTKVKDRTLRGMEHHRPLKHLQIDIDYK